MTERRPTLLVAIAVFGTAALGLAPYAPVTARQGDASTVRPPGTNYRSPAFTFNKIADGVYHAVGTGSLVVMSNAAMGDAYFTEWIQTIEALKQLDFETVLPGHGRAFTGKAQLDHWQAYLRDFWEQAQKFHKAGTPWEAAAKLVDLRGQAMHYPTILASGITPNHGMRRAYEILDGKIK